MKKKIFAFIAVAVLSFGILFAFVPHQRAKAETVVNNYVIDTPLVGKYQSALTYYDILPSSLIFVFNSGSYQGKLPVQITLYNRNFIPRFSNALAVGSTAQLNILLNSTVNPSPTSTTNFFLNIEVVSATISSPANATVTNYSSYTVSNDPSLAYCNLVFSSESFTITFKLYISRTDGNQYAETAWLFLLDNNNRSEFTYFVNSNSGYNTGFEAGKAQGYDTGFSAGRSEGFTAGYEYGREIGDISFFGLISALVDVPVNAFTSLFNFDLLGVNLFSFMSAILTLAFIIAVFRIIWK